ncbi:2,3-diaminopropionate biosynthesis protein SbnA [Actinomycetospora soli]|uniref:2,3-diaminopropionate biosynthesis protein SbnA n=1 Tax=Actinomycetospora soli TaxID=2893887 RepID=UPI001E285331|nr:2,3-diaminopropionate biosynthesis protein SbnA [Actinomycetospora soli]MCD2191540.1 2,3-diaminopropionate biosynthesis protein SbnA [Actinomycetospora soli]
MIHESVVDAIGHTPLVKLSRCFPQADLEVLAKLEMLNPCGSMKDRPARRIVEHGLATGDLVPGMRLVESTSGNLGVALAAVARVHGLKFTAVVDPNTTTANLDLLAVHGAEVDMVTELDSSGGYLHTRIGRARELAASPGTVWVNQYANTHNPAAYRDTLAVEILDAVEGPIDVLVAAVSTTGSLQGIARRLRTRHPGIRIVAVDAVGSVIFGGRPGPRSIPGFGASRVPELLSRDEIDQVVPIDEDATKAGCRRLVDTESILAGGSSGAVIAAIQRLSRERDRPAGRPLRVVTVLPDRGERYLDQIYGPLIDRSNPSPWWAEDLPSFSEEVEPEGPVAAGRR